MLEASSGPQEVFVVIEKVDFGFTPVGVFSTLPLAEKGIKRLKKEQFMKFLAAGIGCDPLPRDFEIRPFTLGKILDE